MASKRGRPQLKEDHDIAKLADKFAKYIDENDIPILAEFAYQNDVTRPWMYDQKEFVTLIKKCLDKKEAALERGTLTNQLNSAMAIFSLKQMGWRDKEAKVVFVDPKTLTDKELKELIDNGS